MTELDAFAPLPVLTHHHVFGLDKLPQAVIDVTGRDMLQIDLSGTTLHAVLWQYVNEHCVPNTSNARRASMAAWEWLSTLGDRFDVSKITRGDGRKVIEALQHRGLKPASVKRIMGIGISALHHAKREGRITDIPKFPKISAGQPRVRWLSREEHRRLMQAPQPPRLKDFFIIAFATGARSQAIEQLTVSRVDFAARTIDFRLPNVDHKNKRRAVVPISDSLFSRLQRMCEGKGPDEPVIGYGKRGRITTLYHHAKAALRSIGIDEPGIARHVARHTVASWLLQGDPERGIPPTPIHLVAQLLGDTVAMIERVYGHLQPKHIASAVNALL